MDKNRTEISETWGMLGYVLVREGSAFIQKTSDYIRKQYSHDFLINAGQDRSGYPNESRFIVPITTV